MIWNAKIKHYNFHVLSFERYGMHQGRNRAWSCGTCIVEVLECSFACNSNMQIWCSLFLEASRSDAWKFQLKNTTFLVILGLCFIFNIFSLISQIWILLLRIFLGDFLGLGKGELTCQRGRRNHNWTHTHASLSPLLWFFPLSFHLGLVWLKLLYLVEGNWSLGINKTVRSNLFLLFDLCFEYQMFFCAYFHDCLV